MIDLAQKGYTHDEVLEYLRFKNGVRKSELKFYAVRNFAYVKLLKCYEKNFTCNYLSQVKFSGEFLFENSDDIQWSTDLIQPVFCLYIGDDELTYNFPRLKPITVTGFDLVRVTTKDETCILENSCIGMDCVIPKDTVYTSYIKNLLNSLGFYSLSIESSAKTVEVERVDFLPETCILTFINELLSEIGFRSLEVDSEGMLMSGVYTSPSYDNITISYPLGSGVLNAVNRSIDLTPTPNVFVGYCIDEETLDTIYYEYENVDSSSFNSKTKNGGYSITVAKEFLSVGSMESLKDSVVSWASQVQENYEHITFTTAIMPYHQVRDVIALSTQDISGVFTEIGWTIHNDDTMSHELRRIYSWTNYA